MAMGYVEFGFPVLLSASGQVGGGTAMARTFPGGANDIGSVAETTGLQCTILGFYVNNTTALTMTLSKGTTSGGTAITGTITPAIGFHRYPVTSDTGLYFNLTGGSGSVTFFVVE